MLPTIRLFHFSLFCVQAAASTFDNTFGLAALDGVNGASSPTQKNDCNTHAPQNDQNHQQHEQDLCMIETKHEQEQCGYSNGCDHNTSGKNLRDTDTSPNICSDHDETTLNPMDSSL